MVTVELPHFQYCPGLTGDAKRLWQILVHGMDCIVGGEFWIQGISTFIVSRRTPALCLLRQRWSRLLTLKHDPRNGVSGEVKTLHSSHIL
jgi:hypothetical protein